MLKEKYVLEYQKLYKKNFNLEITYEEAYSLLDDLVELGKVVYNPIYKKDLEVLKIK